MQRLLEADEARTNSEFERRYVRFARTHGLPRPPGLNVWIAGHEADCVPGAERLVVELDGRAFHRRRATLTGPCALEHHMGAREDEVRSSTTSSGPPRG